MSQKTEQNNEYCSLNSVFLTSMEVEMETILNQAEDRFINPLYKFRKDEIGKSLALIYC